MGSHDKIFQKIEDEKKNDQIVLFFQPNKVCWWKAVYSTTRILPLIKRSFDVPWWVQSGSADFDDLVQILKSVHNFFENGEFLPLVIKFCQHLPCLGKTEEVDIG